MNWLSGLVPSFGEGTFRFGKVEIQKAVRGAVLAAIGAGGAVLLKEMSGWDWGPWTPLAVMLISSAANSFKVWVADNSK